MPFLPNLRRNLEQIVFRNRDPHAIPSMDGALSPNSRLDACQPLGDPLDAPDAVVEGSDGALYVSAGTDVLRLDGKGFARRSVVANFTSRTGGLALHPDGRLLVCVAGQGVAAVDATGRQSWLNQVEDRPLQCATDVAAAADGTVFIAEGSLLHQQADWCRDMMEKNTAGRLIACGAALENPVVLRRDLAWPHGLAIAASDGKLWLTESWTHRISRAAPAGKGIAPVETMVRNLPGYPARLGRALGGGFWLSLFALRTHLVELVLREDEYRGEMMRTIEPWLWIAPALASRGHYLEPMQMGGVKALGVQKPWAPPRSYGLVVKVDEQGDVLESLHSRVGGRFHGITAACETEQGLVIVSKGHGRLLLAGPEARA